MAPAAGLELELVFSWFLMALRIICVGFVLVGIAFIWIHNKGGRSWRIPGVLSICGGAGMLFLLVHTFDSVQAQALGVMELPPEAQVLSAKAGDLSGDGSVTFKLPPNHPVKFWLDTVWKMNASDKSEVSGTGAISFSSASERSVSYSEGSVDLSYDATTKTYSYHSQS